MNMRTLVAMALVSAAGTSEAAILCQKPSGVVVVREACKKKESPLDLARLGLSGASNAFVTGPLPEDANLVAGDTTLRQLSLPPGRYVITASVHFRNNDAVNSGAVSCRLRVDGTEATAHAGSLAPNGVGGDNAFMPLTVAAEVAGEVELACDTFTTAKFKSESIQAFPLPMVAIRVGELIAQ